MEFNSSLKIKDKLPLKSIFFINKIIAFDYNQVGIIEGQSPANGFSHLFSHSYVFQLDNLIAKRRMMENYLEIAENIPFYMINYPHNCKLFSSVLDKIEKII